MNNFAERFKSHSNAQLLNVLQNRKSYQYAAVKAAQEELDSRNLDSAAIQAAQQEMRHHIAQQEEEKRKNEELLRKLKATRDSTAQHASSFLNKPRSRAEKGIIVLCILFGFELLLWLMGDDADLLYYMLTAPDAKWDVLALFLFMPVFVLPPALLLLIFKKKAGWILMVFHIGYTVLSSLFLCVVFLMKWQDLPLPAATLIVGALFYGCTLFFLMTEQVRQLYTIRKNTIVTMIVLSLIIAALSANLLLGQ